jgi:hypothetical protein
MKIRGGKFYSLDIHRDRETLRLVSRI